MKRHEPGTGLGKYGHEILEPTEVKSQDTTFSFAFKSAQKDIKLMIAQRREKRRAKAADQTSEASLKILHLSVTFPAPTIPTNHRHQNRHL